MMKKIAENRMVRKAALSLGDRGVYIPLPKLRRLLQKALSAPGNALKMPPEVALEEGNDLRIIALETALAIHSTMIDAKPEAMRWIDQHLWVDDIRRIYRQVLLELER